MALGSKARIGTSLGVAFWCAIASATVPDLDPIPSLYEEPGLSPNRAYENQHASEAIDPFTGKLQLHAVDFFIPGNGGMDLKVQRSYSSQQARRGLAEPSPFGIGWTMTFGRLLRSAGSDLCQMQLPVRSAPVLELPGGNREVMYDGLDTDRPTFITASRHRGVCRDAGLGMDVYSPDGMRRE